VYNPSHVQWIEPCHPLHALPTHTQRCGWHYRTTTMRHYVLLSTHKHWLLSPCNRDCIIFLKWLSISVYFFNFYCISEWSGGNTTVHTLGWLDVARRNALLVAVAIQWRRVYHGTVREYLAARFNVLWAVSN
jgi:hypothetical protein